MFPTRLLRPARSNPLQGQVVTEPQPPGIVEDEDVEYEVEAILDEKRGRGRGGPARYLVKWVGYTKATWEPYDFVKHLIAFNHWEERKRGGHVPGGGRRGKGGNVRGQASTMAISAI